MRRARILNSTKSVSKKWINNLIADRNTKSSPQDKHSHLYTYIYPHRYPDVYIYPRKRQEIRVFYTTFFLFFPLRHTNVHVSFSKYVCFGLTKRTRVWRPQCENNATAAALGNYVAERYKQPCPNNNLSSICKSCTELRRVAQNCPKLPDTHTQTVRGAEARILCDRLKTSSRGRTRWLRRCVVALLLWPAVRCGVFRAIFCFSLAHRRAQRGVC